VGLVLLALLLAAGAEGLVRLGRRTDGVYHAAGGGVAALLSLALVTPGGLDAPGRAAVVCAVCGAGGLVVNARWRQALLTYAGSGVLLAAVVFALRGTFPDWNAAEVGLVGLLIHATGVLIIGQVLHFAAGGLESVFTVPCRRSALASSLLAVLPLVLTVRWDWLVPCCLCATWLAGIWLVLSSVERRPGLFAAF